MSPHRRLGDLDRCVGELRKDLLRDGGPQISTVRNYNFAILPYKPDDEFALRRRIDALCNDLRDLGWSPEFIALHKLLLRRLRNLEPEYVETLVAREKRLFDRSPQRSLNHLKDAVMEQIEGPNGLAADVIAEIQAIQQRHAGEEDKLVIFLGRAGALYPFLRTSALLKHIQDHTSNLPVVLLYPGSVVGDTGLSFMEEMPADRDYRPRIYR